VHFVGLFLSSSVASLAVPYFSTSSYKRHDFREKKKIVDHEMCVLIFYSSCAWTISHSNKNSARYRHESTWVFM